ncbi:hypothetical protein [Marinobacter sp.]|jgi:hypothetical protein|uniref:hypothetical protein n=1 Tax=Marinobacter sp. TaxID=50741 RepID=UPI0025C620C0|nr:hypothetical protein [Marinobacter sp.]|tara:strand:+ start:693 stop:866 length:174 start_codon:yes stop_codon:yes gene_type:complete
MREIVQKALSVMSQRKTTQSSQARRRNSETTPQQESVEDWGMSPEDALRANTVARYK